eukprot:scaffold451069_cov18-Prasinocladus_malaysianus.AAC.1
MHPLRVSIESLPGSLFGAVLAPPVSRFCAAQAEILWSGNSECNTNTIDDAGIGKNSAGDDSKSRKEND